MERQVFTFGQGINESALWKMKLGERRRMYDEFFEYLTWLAGLCEMLATGACSFWVKTTNLCSHPRSKT
jgi:uncharacterized cupin superfamily protein